MEEMMMMEMEIGDDNDRAVEPAPLDGKKVWSVLFQRKKTKGVPCKTKPRMGSICVRDENRMRSANGESQFNN